jgi:hypothetical protein
LRPIRIVAVVGEIDADVDQVEAHLRIACQLREADIACYLAAPGNTCWQQRKSTRR